MKFDVERDEVKGKMLQNNSREHHIFARGVGAILQKWTIKRPKFSFCFR